MTSPVATISFVDVGQGDCTIAVERDTGEGLLIDCPSGQHGRALAELRLQACHTLTTVIVSHSHEDHFGGVLDVVESLGDGFVGHIFENHESLLAIPVAGDDRRVAGKRLRAMLNRLREYPGRVHKAEAPTTSGAVGSLQWQVVAPTYDEVLDALTEGMPNLASGVVTLTFGATTVIVGGDAQSRTWERLASVLPRSGILRWPHHGGSLGADPRAEVRLLEIVDPDLVVVSVGTNNTHGHPTTAFFDAIAGHRSQLVCTQATMACVSPGRAPGSCAGTIRLELSDNGEANVSTTAVPDHDSVVTAFGAGQCRR